MTHPVASWISPRARKGDPSAVAGRGLFAVEPIAAGDELSTDYALFDMSDDTMACSCGTPSCRGTITGHDWRDPVLQGRYAGWFSQYLADRIAAG
jgi:SET domain-containing protein